MFFTLLFSITIKTRSCSGSKGVEYDLHPVKESKDLCFSSELNSVDVYFSLAVKVFL